jgi:protein involved in polysaccharide export with SLBB domain
MSFARCAASVVLGIAVCFAQHPPPRGRAVYVLAPKDHILIRASQSEKLNGRIFQIQLNGFVNLPTVGKLRAAGLTIESLEKELAGRLRPNSSGEHVVLISVINCSPSRPTCFDSLTRK